MANQTTTRATDVKTYTVDPAHSQVGFTARHMGFSKVRGRFETFDVTVRMNPDALDTLEAEATIEAVSITTNAPDRDKHLRSGDFLLVEEHPQLTFKSREVRDVSANSFTLVGDLTIRGVTKTVAFEGTYLGEGKDPWGGTRVGFEARTKINRKDYGVNWNTALEAGGFLVGDEVEIILEVQAVEQ